MELEQHALCIVIRSSQSKPRKHDGEDSSRGNTDTSLQYMLIVQSSTPTQYSAHNGGKGNYKIIPCELQDAHALMHLMREINERFRNEEGLRDLLQSRPPFLVCMLEVFSSSLTEDENAVQINFRIEMCHLNECQLSLYLLYEECAGRSVLVAMRRSQCHAPELKKCSVDHLLSSSNAQTFMFLPPPRT
ncbi:hypothetical protein Aperf_G00000083832 [Anoplocephala perfoliata]